jgi:hypothetical protein
VDEGRGLMAVKWIAGGTGSNRLFTSDDGATWTPRTLPGSDPVLGLTRGPDLFVVVGSASVVTSPDGVTWTVGSVAAGNAVIYGGGLYVAVGGSGKIYTSPDGLTWTSRTSGTTSPLLAVAYGGGQFVAVGGASASAPIVRTSPDGVTWTSRTAGGSNQFKGIAYGNGVFVAVGPNGTVYTSPDGVTWTSRTAQNRSYLAVAYGAGTFVVVGDQDVVATSPDGITWTERQWSSGGSSRKAVAYSGGMFVSGSGSTVSVSSNQGVAWTPYALSGALSVNAVAVVQNTAPNAPTLTSPADGSTIDRTITQRLAWAFSDPDPGDSQSKFDLQWWDLDGTGARVGAAHTVSQSVPNQFYDVPAGTFTDGPKEWQARTYDAQGVVGPYCTSSFFTAATAPAAPTITAPVSGGPVAVTDTLTWSTPVQDDYQARRVADNAGSPDTGTVYWDSGDVTDSTTRSLTVGFPTNNRWEHVQVRVKDGGLWSTWADVRVDVSWTPPAAPTGVLTPDTATASIAVAITNPAPGAGEPTVSYNNVWLSAAGVPEYRAATLVPTNSTWTFWTPASGLAYMARVVAVATNGTTSETTTA